jgi:hypothetical protein
VCFYEIWARCTEQFECKLMAGNGIDTEKRLQTTKASVYIVHKLTAQSPHDASPFDTQQDTCDGPPNWQFGREWECEVQKTSGELFLRFVRIGVC